MELIDRGILTRNNYCFKLFFEKIHIERDIRNSFWGGGEDPHKKKPVREEWGF